MIESLAGKLLVAAPDLEDPNFFRTVVLIVEHDDEEGALGLVLNRPSTTAVGEHLPEWIVAVADPAVVFVGGPVTPEVAIGLADEPALPPQDWSPALDGIGMVDLAVAPESLGGVRRARVFAGYAGWVVGQLEMEVAIGSWFVVGATAGDVFTAMPDSLWRDVLRRQESRISWFANYPVDPRLN